MRWKQSLPHYFDICINFFNMQAALLFWYVYQIFHIQHLTITFIGFITSKPMQIIEKNSG